MRHCYTAAEAVQILGPYDPSVDYVGPKGREKRVPRYAYGVDLNAAAYVHDLDYIKGGTKEDKKKADKKFLANMYRLIEDHSFPYGTGWCLNFLAKRRVKKYYTAVALFGDSSFCFVGDTSE